MGSYGTRNSFGKTGRVMLLALAIGTFTLSAVGAARNERASHLAGPDCVTIECVAGSAAAAKVEPVGAVNTASRILESANEAAFSHHL